MMFVLSKVVGFVVLPSNAIGMLAALGLLLLALRRRRAGVMALIVSGVLLLIFGFSPAGNVLMLTLSEQFPAWQSGGRDPDGIIVLGGAIDPGLTAARNALEVNSSAERMFAMLDLARRFPKARLVLTGGDGSLLQNSVPEAPIAGKLLASAGLGNGRVTLESASRTTAENAAFTRRLVTPQPGERWLLVTSAFHMPRAVAAFRAAGFGVEAYPVDFRTSGWHAALRPFARLSSGLARSDVAMHEWIGLIELWLTGQSPTLVPTPQVVAK